MEENLENMDENHMTRRDSKSGDDINIESDNVTREENDATNEVITSADFTLVKTEDGFLSACEWSHNEVKVEHVDTMEYSDHLTVESKDYIKPEGELVKYAAIGANDFMLVKAEDDFHSECEWSNIEVKAEHDNMECRDHHAVKSNDYINGETDDLTGKNRKGDGDEVAGLSSEIPDRLKKAVSVGDAYKDFNKPELNGASSPLSGREHITGQEKTYSCYVCTYESKFKSNLIIHTRWHTGEKPFLCDSCDYICSSAGLLRSHMWTHIGEKPFSCGFCDYQCSRAGDLRRHMRTHTGEKPYSCKSCEYRSRGAGDLRRHLRTHTGERPFLCNSCDFRCSHASTLKAHMSTHTGEIPFSCDFCGYRSSRAGDLRRHVRTHTGEKPFSCSSCDYRGSQASCLKEHMRTHTGEKPYSCNSCEYRCSGSGDLRMHMRTHTGEKPFSCDSCDYKCCTAGSLRKHVRIHSTS